MIIDTIKVCYGILVLLAALFGRLTQFFIAFDFDYDYEIANLDEKVRVALGALGVFTLLPRVEPLR